MPHTIASLLAFHHYNSHLLLGYYRCFGPEVPRCGLYGTAGHRIETHFYGENYSKMKLAHCIGNKNIL